MQGDAIIVTGASRGIGRETALLLAEKGFHVVINYVRNQEEAEQVKAEIEKKGVQALVVQADVSNFEQSEMLVKQCKETFGNVYGLINNAGITQDGMMMRMSQKAYDDVIQLNLNGAFYCMRHASAVMLRQKRGRIVNMSSVAGVMGNAGQVNYSAAKAGMIGMTKAAARELAPRGITVNAIAPGLIETDMTRAMPEDARAKLLTSIPLGRMGEVREVAELVAFLCSEQAGYITGQTLCIDGGLAI